MSPSPPTASIVIPAHNEERAIGRLLDQLLADAHPHEFEVFVLCNGCSDRTSSIARSYQPAVRVIDLPEPSKRAALKHGDTVASAYPRLYIDSDVEIGTDDVRALIRALDAGVLAAAPTRRIPRERSSVWVRAYYDVWERLPQVRTAPFGRGVVALSRAGWERVEGLDAAMADDLVMTASFTQDECTINPSAHVVIWPPQTVADLLRRRARVNVGNAEVDQSIGRSAELRTSLRDLATIVRRRPVLAPQIGVFLCITLMSRIRARRQIRAGDFTTWLRDESSRT